MCPRSSTTLVNGGEALPAESLGWKGSGESDFAILPSNSGDVDDAEDGDTVEAAGCRWMLLLAAAAVRVAWTNSCDGWPWMWLLDKLPAAGGCAD